jgi:hypothetical protein
LSSLRLKIRYDFKKSGEKRGYILVPDRSYDNLFTAESQRAQSEISFSFAAETPENENNHASGNLGAF